MFFCCWSKEGVQHGDPINDDVFLGRWVGNKRNDDTDDEFLDSQSCTAISSPRKLFDVFVKKKHYHLPLFGLGGDTKNISMTLPVLRNRRDPDHQHESRFETWSLDYVQTDGAKTWAKDQGGGKVA